MKNKVFVFILLSALILIMVSSCASPKEITVGMSYEEAISLRPDSFYYIKYMFYTENEKNIVITFEKEKYLVEKIEEFPVVTANQMAISSIKEGMTVSEVVRLVGIPTGSTESGLIMLNFQRADGSTFYVEFDGNMKVISVLK